jgi:hypothetical protein
LLQVIDLELLDALGASRGTEELKEELRRQEQAYAQELAEWDHKISSRMDELVGPGSVTIQGAGSGQFPEWFIQGPPLSMDSGLLYHLEWGGPGVV